MTSKIDDSRMQRVGGPVDRCSEGQLFHKKVDPGVHFKAVKVVGVSLQPHKQTSIRHIGRTESISTSYNYFFFCHRHICHIFMRMSCFLLYILNNFICHYHSLMLHYQFTYRRVAASVDVSSPSILYTFPYITYSNCSALQNQM